MSASTLSLNQPLLLDAVLRERVQQLAGVRQRSADALLRDAVSQYIEREEQREAFRLAALQAGAAYDKTGLHLSAAEMDDWMGQLESGQDAPLPLWHP
jgi:predicted transcriptional regulator